MSREKHGLPDMGFTASPISLCRASKTPLRRVAPRALA